MSYGRSRSTWPPPARWDGDRRVGSADMLRGRCPPAEARPPRCRFPTIRRCPAGFPDNPGWSNRPRTAFSRSGAIAPEPSAAQPDAPDSCTEPPSPPVQARATGCRNPAERRHRATLCGRFVPPAGSAARRFGVLPATPETAWRGCTGMTPRYYNRYAPCRTAGWRWPHSGR